MRRCRVEARRRLAGRRETSQGSAQRRYAGVQKHALVAATLRFLPSRRRLTPLVKRRVVRRSLVLRSGGKRPVQAAVLALAAAGAAFAAAAPPLGFTASRTRNPWIKRGWAPESALSTTGRPTRGDASLLRTCRGESFPDHREFSLRTPRQPGTQRIGPAGRAREGCPAGTDGRMRAIRARRTAQEHRRPWMHPRCWTSVRLCGAAHNGTRAMADGHSLGHRNSTVLSVAAPTATVRCSTLVR